MHQEAPFEVAIVGGGIVGVTLAAGLVRRNIKVKLFEQAKNFGEIGVGIGFTSNTVRCMQQINPDIVDALRQGGAVPNNAFRYLDGFAQPDPDDAASQRRLAFLDAGPMGWETVRRDMFLMELVKRVPQEVFRLNSRLANVEQDGPHGKVVLTFEDGTTHSADAVISCDGIKSKTRRILLGPNDPATPPQYTHKCAYRTLVPIEKVREALGEYKTRHLHFHLGPGAHLLHYPVNSKMVGSAVYVHDPNDWPLNGPMTAQGKREDVIQAVAGWSEPIQKLVKLFPETLEKWALFDMYEYPLRQYNWDRIALAGDAAHASSPHHGAGASFGIEDVLCLSTLLEDATTAVQTKQVNKNQALKLAFQSYDTIRRTRTQWLVNSSRRTCNLYQQEEWGDPTRTVKAETCFEEVRDRSYKIWNFDSVGMVNDTAADYAKRLKEYGCGTNGHSAKHSDLTTNGVTNGISNGVPNGHANGHANGHTNGYTNGTNGVTNGGTKAPTYDWLVNIPDMPNKTSDRLANLQTHMANSKKQLENGKLVMAGPAFSSSDIQNQSQKPGMTGSVQVIRGRDAEEVLQILGQDPFAKLGVWDLDRATLQPMRVGLMQPPTA